MHVKISHFACRNSFFICMYKCVTLHVQMGTNKLRSVSQYGPCHSTDHVNVEYAQNIWNTFFYLYTYMIVYN